MNETMEKTMDLKLKYYTDPGHGWVAVKRKVLEGFMPLAEVSSFSYVKGKTVYLEEDLDAARFLKAVEAQGYTVILESKHTDRRSPIRSYDSVGSVA
jgi:hypothetical protein